jgi:hypothetical protein
MGLAESKSTFSRSHYVLNYRWGNAVRTGTEYTLDEDKWNVGQKEVGST